MRPASPAEDRVVRALRQAGVITANQSRATLDILEATETCDRCGGDGIDPDSEQLVASGVAGTCVKCEGSGQMRTLR